ncbi:hypothetical protein PHISCL_05059 [Aspergillus sclerotialis]|uniref:Uncharacterized protein n=1 Tax=Aspergillus sclerotialis TaxID=2070753 RepID=A0A3A2ZZU5_9EURO|nr:hypothetical protein PHISCL_05059 [Aspergillus sclerotialis]
MERRYETTESDTNINNKGGLHYSVQYNPSSQGTPGYQRLHREDGKAKELNKPLSSIFATLLEALLCAVALCFIGMLVSLQA